MSESTENAELFAAMDLCCGAKDRLSADSLTPLELQSTIQSCGEALNSLLNAVRPIVVETPESLLDHYSALRSIAMSCNVAASQFEERGSDPDFVNVMFDNLNILFSTTVPLVLSIIVDLKARPAPPGLSLSPSVN